MNESKILAEVKKVIDLWIDGTYSVEGFYSAVTAIIKNNSEEAEIHKNHMERMIYKVEQLREAQRLFHGGHKSKLSECKALENDIDKKIIYLKTVKGYDSDRFKFKVQQKNMF